MIGFHDVTFPEDVSWGSSGGPQFKTHVFTSFRGFEKRNIEWSQPMMRFNVAFGVKTDDQMLRLIDFFNARQGQANGFRYKNWANFKIQNAPIATGDGYSTRLPLYKFYGFNGARHYKRLRKIARGSVRGVQLYIEPGTEGVDYTIDYDSGEIAVHEPIPYGKPIYAQNLEFHEPVRFTDDNIQIIIDAYNSSSLSTLELLSVRSTFNAGSVFAPGDADTADPFYQECALILNFDDAGDPATTMDQSQLALPVVLSGTAQLDTSKFRHGGSSLSLGATGMCSVSGATITPGKAAYTLEGFFEAPSDGATMQPMFGKWDAPSSMKSFLLRYNFVRKRIEYVISTDGADERILMSYPWRGQRGRFDHISVSRTAAWWYVLRINGEVVQTVRDVVQPFDANAPVTIGSYPVVGSADGIFQGNIDSIRFTIGRTRAAHFEKGTIPTPYTAS